ncbi:MAG: citramalate synthase [Anaerolineae bacterium]|nr:citramalate synthase [Anaerolineae bacterium]
MATLELYDTTLRDGAQHEGIAFSLEDKLKITLKLDELGIAYIEGGWPGSNPKDAAYFAAVRELPLQQAQITAFGCTCRAGQRPEEDPQILALLDAGTPAVALVGKSWDLHVRDVLGTTLEENLRMIRESVRYLKAKGRVVFYDAEHFFDGYRADPDYALATLEAAAEGGADRLVLCDTNGGTMPWEVEEVVRQVAARLDVPLGIHAHNDAGCAVANSLAAVRAGAVQVQGTVNGYGERVGNADLCTLIPNFVLKMGLPCVRQDQLRRLTAVSRFVSETANVPHDAHLPYVGKAAFAHKGGLHVHAILRDERAYQHVDPALVGNEKRVLVSELSGRGNLLYKAQEFGLDADGPAVRAVLAQIKELESQGFHFEGAEASVDLMLRRAQPGYQPPFELVDFMVVVEHRLGRGVFAEATVKVKVGGQAMHTAAEGNGPVNALDHALRKALLPHYPALASIHLTDYKVRILDGEHATAAITRVIITSSDGKRSWSTVGCSTNIIEASWQALADSMEYGLLNGAAGRGSISAVGAQPSAVGGRR